MKMEESEEEKNLFIKKLTCDENLNKSQELEALNRLNELLTNQSCRSSTESSKVTPDLIQFEFLQYLFVRRFKWMEAKNCQESVKDGALNQSELCGPLDQILSCLSKEKITEESLKVYKRLYNHVNHLPVVRSQLAGHIMLWLSNSTTSINSPYLFPYILEILVLFITDVWSAIRKTSCSRLGVIVQYLDDTHIELLFRQLVQICFDNESEWQPINGAILGITVILNQYVSDLKCIPESIGQKVLPTIFHLICHPQLSIRETAVKALTVYITSCNTHTVTSTLLQVITLLGYKPSNHQREISSESLVEAYKAEGLLKICSSIIKVLPLSCLLSEWLSYLTVFISYLSHEASTVRQTTSLVFKQLVCKCDSNPVLFKSVMGKLVLDWSPSCGTTTSTYEDNCSKVKTWESKEGRLFVYELICEYLVKNHWLMTFGPLQPTKHGELRRLSTTALSTSGINKEELEKIASTSPIWSEIFSELAGKSLLQQTYLYDRFTLQFEDSIKDFGWLFMEQCRRHNSDNNTQHIEDISWLKTVKIQHCQDLLHIILHQTLECLLDSQWELKRIAQQVLPLLSEVIRWYDIDLNKSIIKDNLASNNPTMVYMASFLLKESLEHCVRLLPLLKDPPKSWKDELVCCETIENLLQSLKQESGYYISTIEKILYRPSFDRLSLLAVEIIIILVNHFSIPDNEKISVGESFFNFWQTLFQFAHPTSQICHILQKKTVPTFSSPYAGYLSCCLVEPESDILCARQVEKCLVLAVYEHLTLYLSRTCQPRYLPIITHYIGLFADDSMVCKELVHCLLKLSVVIVDPVLKRNISTDMKPLYLKCLYYTLKEFSAIIAIKTFDTALLEKILSIYLVLCRPINPNKHLPSLFKAICSRLNKGRSTSDVSPRYENPGIDTGLNGYDKFLPTLYQGHISCLEIENNDFPDFDANTMYTECLSLNTSFSKRRTLSVSIDTKDKGGGSLGDAEDSDWDSWSEDDEDESNLTSTFTDFLFNMKKSMNLDCKEMMNNEVKKLKTADRETIHRLTTF